MRRSYRTASGPSSNNDKRERSNKSFPEKGLQTSTKQTRDVWLTSIMGEKKRTGGMSSELEANGRLYAIMVKREGQRGV